MEIFAPPASPGFARCEIDSDELYRAIFGHFEFASYVLRIDEDGTCTFEDAGDGVERMVGCPPQSLIGHSPADAMPSAIARGLLANLETCLESERGLTYEAWVEGGCGRVAWMTTLIPVADRSGRIHHVFGLARDITRQATMIARAKHNASLLQRLGMTLPSAIYMYDVKTRRIHFIGGEVDERRRAWRRQAEEAGAEAGKLFIHPDDLDRAEAHHATLAALKDGEVVTIDYRILTPDGDYRRFQNRDTVFTRNDAGEVVLVLGVSEDISEQELSRQKIRDLSEKMLSLQVDEQRRIAQEFHDSTGQHLVAASLALSRLQTGVAVLSSDKNGRDSMSEAIADARQSLQRAHRELRVLSYLLHPPEIRDQGLGDALSSFAAGFARRAGIEIETRVSAAANDIEEEMAVHLFRVCQEAFTNVHRHAAANRVTVELDVQPNGVRLTIADDGIGLDRPERQRLGVPGVGFDGMRERMSRLGGSVEVSSGKGGTTLVAVAPRGMCTAIDPRRASTARSEQA